MSSAALYGFRTRLPCLLALLSLACEAGEAPREELAESDTFPPTFEEVQPGLFSAPGAQPLAWADSDGDGDLDLFAGFRGAPNRLYRNDAGSFTDVAREAGLDDDWETRSAAWGDYDNDGDPDLLVGFRQEGDRPLRLYRNDGPGAPFTDTAPGLGLDLPGNTRQVSWLDYDGDGDLDLFVAFRDGPNRLFRNELLSRDSRGRRIRAAGGPSFTDVTEESGIGDPRRTVGVAWFDMDQDGDLDAFVANQNGDQDGFFRNEGGVFVDVAPELGMAGEGRTEEIGGVGPAVADYDNDGDLDLFVANYGPDVLWRNEGNGRFTEVARGTPLGEDYHSTAAAWGDFDNDGFQDLFVVSYLSDMAEVADHLFRNLEGSFRNVTPDLLQHPGASHGVSWADFDGDGDLDLALANNHPEDGGHPLYRNLLPEDRARHSLQVRVVDSNGIHRFPGAEIRIYAQAGEDAPEIEEDESPAGMSQASDPLLATGMVDTGGGYCSQGVAPVHFGIPAGIHRVKVEVTVPDGGARRVHTVQGVPVPMRPFQVLEIRLPEVF
ncbi:MAG: CRTAC1 family protein [Longimicrobiales bacterium]